MSDTKKWVKVSRSAKGETTVRVSLQRDNLSANWAVKSYVGGIKQGVAEATKGAERALDDLTEAVNG